MCVGFEEGCEVKCWWFFIQIVFDVVFFIMVVFGSSFFGGLVFFQLVYLLESFGQEELGEFLWEILDIVLELDFDFDLFYVLFVDFINNGSKGWVMVIFIIIMEMIFEVILFFIFVCEEVFLISNIDVVIVQDELVVQQLVDDVMVDMMIEEWFVELGVSFGFVVMEVEV